MTGCFDFLFSFSSAILLSKMKSLFSQPLYQFSVSHVTTSTTYYHRNHVLIYNSKDFRWWNFDIQFHCTGILISKVAILGRSEILSNQVFEGVKFMTIVKASDIFGKFFDVRFFILENVIPQMPLPVIYQTRASFFWSTRLCNGKYTSARDLCCSEPAYLTPERDNSYVRCLGWFG